MWSSPPNTMPGCATSTTPTIATGMPSRVPVEERSLRMMGLRSRGPGKGGRGRSERAGGREGMGGNEARQQHRTDPLHGPLQQLRLGARALCVLHSCLGLPGSFQESSPQGCHKDGREEGEDRGVCQRQQRHRKVQGAH